MLNNNNNEILITREPLAYTRTRRAVQKKTKKLNFCKMLKLVKFQQNHSKYVETIHFAPTNNCGESVLTCHNKSSEKKIAVY